MTLEQIARRIGRIGRRLIEWWWTPLRLAGVALLVLAILVGILGYLNEHGGFYLRETPRRILAYLSANVSVELASIAITIIFVDALYQHRETEREKKRLILQMGSPDNAFAREAARALRSQGWLQDGSLKDADLRGADLQGALLGYADLQRADVGGANLQGASLEGAKLQGADLWLADLKNAYLVKANLQGANLKGVDLQGVDLRIADLQGADMRGANLQGAYLGGARLQEADMRHTKLQGAKWEANLRETEYNNATRWPEGFTPPPEAINVDAEANVED
jgi:hypothetical protein